MRPQIAGNQPETSSTEDQLGSDPGLVLSAAYHRLAEVGRREVAEIGDCLLGVPHRLLVVEAVTDEGLREERQEQERAEEEGERVLADETQSQ